MSDLVHSQAFRFTWSKIINCSDKRDGVNAIEILIGAIILMLIACAVIDEVL